MVLITFVNNRRSEAWFLDSSSLETRRSMHTSTRLPGLDDTSNRPILVGRFWVLLFEFPLLGGINW